MKPLKLEFCGEWFDIEPTTVFTIGREADLVIDDNPRLHRIFLTLSIDSGLWWLSNVGALLSATVTDGTGAVQSWLAPGARLPVVFERMHVLFTAGATSYDFVLENPDQIFSAASPFTAPFGATTVEAVPLTISQRSLIVALAENTLVQSIPGRGRIPSSAEAAERLGWSMTTFNRKLDNVCDKLDRAGVPGLRGSQRNLATDRRARLVEYAVATRLVTRDDLAILDTTRERRWGGAS